MATKRLAEPMLQIREATSADVPAMVECRAADARSGPADHRMAAYLEGQHHPQQALAPRTAFVALVDGQVAGYTAGHATTRHGCDGELQYLYVAPSHRRHGVARALLKAVAGWFLTHEIEHVCVNVDTESPGALPFYTVMGARPIQPSWYEWTDIGDLLTTDAEARGGND